MIVKVNSVLLQFRVSGCKIAFMENRKLCVVMVGLPARGKSTIASRLKDNLIRDGIKTAIFNNGDLRRKLISRNTSSHEFYDPNNKEGVKLREKIALMNIKRATDYLDNGGRVAILDATNVSLKRRGKITNAFKSHSLLFIECINNDTEILKASILRKITHREFKHMTKEEATQSFQERIRYYESIYRPLKDENNFIKLDSLKNMIIGEEISENIPYFDRLRDFLVTDSVRNLYLIRHGETYFNLEDRIGGDSHLTKKGKLQAFALAEFFKKKKIPLIFTSAKIRTIQTGEPIKELQQNCEIIPLEEFNEIDSGICECMTYEEIRREMPGVFYARKADKYNYIYPKGEGYVSMNQRVEIGIKKALYLSTNSQNLMIIGHRAVNRMILSHFLYRRKEDVPYIYIPQDKFYHIVATQDKKVFRLKKYEKIKKGV